MSDDIYGVLSLASKAGCIVRGQGKCEAAIKKKKARLCIMASDASENTRDRFFTMCEYHDTEYISLLDKSTLGRLFGMDEISVCVITDDNFYDLIRKKLERSKDGRKKSI